MEDSGLDGFSPLLETVFIVGQDQALLRQIRVVANHGIRNSNGRWQTGLPR
jgi:hypothetical protein